MEITNLAAWGIVCLISSFGRAMDITLVLGFRAYKDWELLQSLWIATVNMELLVQGVVILIAAFISIQLVRFALNLCLEDTDIRTDEFPVGPLLFPCQTDHVRLVPTKHTFSYSYLLVGVPVRWRGNHGGMISCEENTNSRPWYMAILNTLGFGLGGTGAWWKVNGADYLGRGENKDGLRGKLKEYLESQGIDPNQYDYAYLLTAARFLGYASNPVSIWHLYSSKLELKALVLEVNNTFDERHNYFLEPSSTPSNILSAKPTRYTGTWPKDFYVSVFNSRSGAYSLSAIDPLAPMLYTLKDGTYVQPAAHIDSTITLSLPSPSTKPMLVARVYSSSPPLDPSKMSLYEKTSFLFSWWWVGFATFPRTIIQALTILLVKKLPWVFIPQPRKNTTPAHASPDEVLFERHFRNYLRHVVQTSPSTLRVRYIPAGITYGEEETMVSNPPGNDSSHALQDLEIRILTPLFYSRLIHYASLHDALLWERHSATLSLSDPLLLSNLDFSPLSTKGVGGVKDNILYNLILTLKRRPRVIEPLADELAARDEKVKREPTGISYKEMKGFVPKGEWEGRSEKGISGLDAWVLASRSGEERSTYAKAVLGLIFTDRLGFGHSELLSLELFILRVLVAWAVVELAS